MQVLHEEQGPVDVFHISGRLDYTAVAADFDDLLRAPWVANPERRFPILELNGVTMMSSQALRSILALAKDLQGQGGKVYVTQPSGSAREALKVSGFLDLRIFELHEQQQDAIVAATLASRKAAPLPGPEIDPWNTNKPTGEDENHVEKKSGCFGAIINAWLGAAGVIQSILDVGKKK